MHILSKHWPSLHRTLCRYLGNPACVEESPLSAEMVHFDDCQIRWHLTALIVQGFKLSASFCPVSWHDFEQHKISKLVVNLSRIIEDWHHYRPHWVFSFLVTKGIHSIIAKAECDSSAVSIEDTMFMIGTLPAFRMLNVIHCMIINWEGMGL